MIAENLLIHNCVYSQKDGMDRDGNAITTLTEVQRVRITPVYATNRNSTGEEKADKLTLFYAPLQSTPQINFKELDGIIWNDKTYTIRSVTPCYTDNEEIHHYEIALI